KKVLKGPAAKLAALGSLDHLVKKAAEVYQGYQLCSMWCSDVYIVLSAQVCDALRCANPVTGERGRDGPQGQKGPVGHEGAQITNGYRDGFLFTVHSQSQENPVCPDGTLTMYSGYSLLYISVNSWGHGQDLGTLGSCLVQFSTVPFLFCDPNETCYYAASDSNSYWLSTDTPMPRDTSATTLAQYISRCSVCEASGNVIVIHSQMSTEQDCPSGWQELWSGYSFVMQTGTEAEGSGQPLASPGSCLKKFQKVPFIECHASGTCKYSFDSNSHWLAVVDRNRMF
ncbi:hypothetical protein P4O66_017862, partial [Electrophorus voltai]